MRVFAACVVACVLASERALARADQPPTIVGYPVVTYDNDLGLFVGVFGAFYDHAGGAEPYREAIQGQIAFSTRGAQDHDLALDVTNLLGARWLLEAHLLVDRHAQYFGLGNATGESGDPARFSLVLGQLPQARLSVRRPVLGRLAAVASYRFLYETVRAGPEKLLSLERPLGYRGGRTAELQAGLFYDARDVESEPTRGVLLEASVRAASPLLGGEFAYGGFNFTVRDYVRLGSERLVLAGRAIADATGGDVPFFVMPELGGTAWIIGPGGASTLRGYPRSRLLGKARFIGNLEVRGRAATFHVFDHTLDVWLDAFSDAARVFRDLAPDGPLFAGKISAGGGARLVLQHDFVVRFDWAHGLFDRDAGFYAVVGEAF